MTSQTKTEIDNNAKFVDKISEFLDYCSINLGLSVNTTRTYAHALRSFSKYVGKDFYIFEICQKVVEDYIISNKHLAPSSLCSSISSIHSFVKFCAGAGYIPTDTLSTIRQPKIPKTLPMVLNEEEMTVFLTPEHEPTTVLEIRNQAILELLYGSGARASELCGINIRDISTRKDKASLRLTGKGNKERVVPITKIVKDNIDRYLLDARPRLLERRQNRKDHCETNRLFFTSLGKKFDRKELWDVVRARNDITLKDNRIHPHTFRHSYATHLLDGGANIRDIQQLLGHESLLTTMIYTHVTNSHLRSVIDVNFPRQ